MVTSVGEQRRPAGGLSTQLSASPAWLHPHCLLLLKGTSAFATLQCVLTFQVKKKKKSLLANGVGVWAAVLWLTGAGGVWVPLSGCSAGVCKRWSGAPVIASFFLLAQCVSTTLWVGLMALGLWLCVLVVVVVCKASVLSPV